MNDQSPKDENGKFLGGNPTGAGVHATVKSVRIRSRETVAELLWEIMNLNRTQLETRVKARGDEMRTIFEESILRGIARDMVKGETKTVEMLMNRTMGQAKQYIDLNAVIDNSNAMDFSKLTLEEKKVLLALQRKGSLKPGNGHDT
jgi:hypothetical protein